LGGFDGKAVMPPKIASSKFEIICLGCDSVGIVFDCSENAPSSTPIKCRHCGALRGTLGELRNLSASGQHDLFEI
jgi:ribosomal protein S27E